MNIGGIFLCWICFEGTIELPNLNYHYCYHSHLWIEFTDKQKTLEECLQLLSTAFARGNLGGLFKGTEGVRVGIRETRAGIAHVSRSYKYYLILLLLSLLTLIFKKIFRRTYSSWRKWVACSLNVTSNMWWHISSRQSPVRRLQHNPIWTLCSQEVAFFLYWDRFLWICWATKHNGRRVGILATFCWNSWTRKVDQIRWSASSRSSRCSSWVWALQWILLYRIVQLDSWRSRSVRWRTRTPLYEFMPLIC